MVYKSGQVITTGLGFGDSLKPATGFSTPPERKLRCTTQFTRLFSGDLQGASWKGPGPTDSQASISMRTGASAADHVSH